MLSSTTIIMIRCTGTFRRFSRRRLWKSYFVTVVRFRLPKIDDPGRHRCAIFFRGVHSRNNIFYDIIILYTVSRVVRITIRARDIMLFAYDNKGYTIYNNMIYYKAATVRLPNRRCFIYESDGCNSVYNIRGQQAIIKTPYAVRVSWIPGHPRRVVTGKR